MRSGRWVRAGAALLVVGACTQKPAEQLPPECDQEGPQTDAGQGGGVPVAWMGAVRVAESRDHKSGAAVTGSVAASFYDVSNYAVEAPQALDLSPTCRGITGQPATTGTRTALGVDRVEVSGTVGGAVTLSAPDGGSLSHSTAGAVLGADGVAVNVVGRDGGFVNGGVAAMVPPAPMLLSSPDLSGAGHVGDSDVVVRWQAGTDPAALVSVELTTGAGSAQTRATIQCVVKDDGCHVVPSGALTWMTAGRSEPITVVVKRNVSTAVLLAAPVDGGAGLVMTLSQEARGELLP
ncbi:MAG: hypothetical protein HY904_25655 [Deltaproteobacteria bacterium]|nr:hypothetical protein [Deltaproteobacteria bacterium]